MRGLRRVAIAAVIMTYLLIFIGGLVRVSGAGLGCPDWPKCFGEWAPPTTPAGLQQALEKHPERDELLARSPDARRIHVNATQTDVVFAWIEYINRLFGVVVGFLILATTAGAVMYARRRPWILWPAIATLLLVLFQGWLGALVVASNLEPLMVSLHLILALVIIGLQLWIAQQIHYEVHPEAEAQARYPEGLSTWLQWLLAGFGVQVLLGTLLRGAHDLFKVADLLGVNPEQTLWHALDKPAGFLHQILGIVVAGGAVHVGMKIVKRGKRISDLALTTSWAFFILAALQILIGHALVFFGRLPILQVFHLWSSAILFGALLLQWLGLRRNRELTHG
ncbi:hypothetical protein GF324_06425 [bacterium]|nr:hypothetical protein [bacterium]